MQFFDDIVIEDPRVADFCAKTMEPPPHTILQTCLARNFGAGGREIKYHVFIFFTFNLKLLFSMAFIISEIKCEYRNYGTNYIRNYTYV